MGFLWRLSDSSSGESQHFQTCSKPKGLRQACSGYLHAFLTLNNLHGPRNPVNIYVSIYIRGRQTELWSKVTFIYDLPLTRLTEASHQAGGNQMSGWVFTRELYAASYRGAKAPPPPPLLWPTSLNAFNFALWHIALTEDKFLSVSSG